MAERIRVGIIGQGRSGRDIHAHALATVVPGLYEIVAVADLQQERCDRAVKELGCKAYTDYRKLFAHEDIDLIVNASPSHLHVPITLEALEAGFNVLCEKPVARRAKEVDGIVAKARKKGRLLAAFQQSRFAPYFLKVRELIDSGVLGRVVMIKISFSGFARRWDWQTLQDHNGGNLLNTGPHPVDQALQLIGTDAMPRVSCLMDRAVTFGDAEDHVKVILSRPGRPTVDIEISSCNPYNLFTYQVLGTQGGLTGTMDRLEWKWFDPAQAPQQHLTAEPLPGPSYCTETLPWQTGSWEAPKSGLSLFDTMAKPFYENLHAALTEGAPLAVPMEHVRLQIAVIEECHRQAPLPRRSPP
ncbi:MAG: oxidoreductase [Spirochaetes bacterium RBG_13_68_11]|nr:MAG: oxidoreductase [Spirochaetes bacterium RBG_13_68_11]